MQIQVGVIAPTSSADLDVEVVERKGLGHPDTICDALAEAFSARLSRFYRERFGLILHHNVDKVLLRGGSAEPAFGGGRVTAPIEIFLAGRATTSFGGVEVPVDELAIESSRAWLKKHLHALDVDRDVRIHPLVRPGSRDLVELYLRQHEKGVWLANDSSCGVGFAPLSALETLVLDVEQGLNRPTGRQTCPEFGEDIKVMGVRRGQHMHLTIACAMIDRFLAGLTDYLEAKRRLEQRVQAIAAERGQQDVEIEINTSDDPAKGSVYLTVTGSSAEAGDDGEAGRGNRVNGLITPFRPMTMESVAGKNPVTHVGKLYNLCASLTAARIVEQIPDVVAASCVLVSEIGRPIDRPMFVDVRVRLAEDWTIDGFKPEIEQILWAEISALPRLAEELIDGRIALDRWPLRAPLMPAEPGRQSV